MRDVLHGATGIIQRVKLRDIGASDDSGYTGLTKNSSGLQITSMTDNEKTRTAYTAAASTIEAITSIGVYEAPSSAGACRFSEVDASALPGHYEIHLRNERYAVTSAKVLFTTIFGTASAAQTDMETRLRSASEQDTLNSALFAVVSAVQVTASGTKSDSSALLAAQPAIGVDASAAAANTVTILSKVSAVKVDTSSVLTDTGTALPAQVSAVKVDASSAAADASSILAAQPAIGVDASVAAANTGTLLAKVSAVKLDTSAVLSDTGTTLPSQIASGHTLASARGTMQSSIFVLASTTKITASTTKSTTSSIEGRIPTALASGFMKTDVLRINGNANAAARQALAAVQMIPFVVDEALTSATTAQFHSDNTIPDTTDNFWNDTLLLWTTGNLAGQRSTITACASATGGRVLFTMASTTSEPTTGDTGLLI